MRGLGGLLGFLVQEYSFLLVHRIIKTLHVGVSSTAVILELSMRFLLSIIFFLLTIHYQVYQASKGYLLLFGCLTATLSNAFPSLPPLVLQLPCLFSFPIPQQPWL